MKKELKFIQTIHNRTKRKYLPRMINKKVEGMNIAKKFSFDYWDGKRDYGYGGYNYMPGYWKPLAKKLIKEYNLNIKSRVLDVGCGKGYLLYEISLLIPGINIIGFDISKYALKHSKKNGATIFIYRVNIKLDQNPYTPQEQLKIVLPRKSLNLLREPIKNIEDYPEDATECYLLKRYLWESYYKI